MKNKEALKKHHFWILLGFVPLFVLIAVLVVSSSVGGAIAERDKKITDATKEIGSKSNPKPVALIEKIETMNATVASKKGDLWKDNWERQAGIDPASGKQDSKKNLFTWPNSTKLKAIEKAGLKFGEKIPNPDGEYREFPRDEVYLAQYSNAKPGFPGTGMADQVYPTQFNGGWQKVLRHVNKQSDVQLTSEQIWLMMEDIWVQRSLLDAIRAVNEEMAEFKRIKFEKGGQVIDDPDNKATQDPLRRRFRSRTWDLELEVIKKDNQQLLIGRLTNITDRLQLMGLNNTMIVKVWLEPGTDGKGKGVEPFEFRIGGESLKGVGAFKADGSPANTIEIAPLPDQQVKDYPNVIPPGKNIAELARVEQLFDARTVPVRRIETMALGFKDSRTETVELVTHKSMEPKDGAVTPTTPTDDFTTLGGSGSRPNDPRSGAGSGATAVRSGGGAVADVIDANKKRYLVANDQVRRMPVGIVVVVDQSNVQDVLLAFANSPLRFQITQVNWIRFRGSLGGGASTGGSSGGGDAIFLGGGGDSSIHGRGEDGRGGGSGPPPGIGPMAPGISRGSGGGGKAGGGNFGGGMQFNPGGSGTLTTVSESQLTSGLVELSVYGVVSLYEKYVPSAEEIAAEAKDKEKEKDQKEPGDKDPKDPMTNTPTTPKMRSRQRPVRVHP